MLNYAVGLNSSSAERKSFNASAPGKYDILDDEFSNHFEVDQFSNQGGASFNYRAKKSTLQWGTQVNNVNYNQLDVVSKTEYNRNFLNWMPQASYQYRFSTQRSLRVGYNGRTSQPSVTQLQPVLNNIDPLNRPLGNPNLSPSYTNNFNINFNSYKVLTNQQIYVSGNYSFTSNAIVSDRVTDTAGVTTYKSINLTNKTPFTYNMYVDLGRKFKFIDMNVGIGLNSYGGTSYNYINKAVSKNKKSFL